MHSAHPPNPKRFEVYTELKDGSGFTIKGTDFVYKFDRYGGWFDEYANYYNANGEPEEPPSDSEHYEPQSHSEGSDDHYGDEFEKEFGGPKNYDDEDEEDPTTLKIASNLSILHQYPANKPFRIKFSNMSYFSRRPEVFEYFQHKVEGLLNVIFLENERGQFNGNGYFIVKDIQSGEELVRLEGEKVNNRDVRFSVPDVEEFLQEPLDNEELFPDFHKHKNKNYITKGKNSQPEQPKPEPKLDSKPQPKPQPKVETKVQPKIEPKVEPKIETKVQPKVQTKPEPKVQPKVQPKAEPKVEPKVVPKVEVKVVGPNDFVTYKFLKTAFPLKSSFKNWITDNKFDNSTDIQKVNKIEGDENFALVTMKKKVYDKLNNSFYNGKKIVFEPK